VSARWWEEERWRRDLYEYVVILRAFLDDHLSGDEFELLYLALFKADSTDRPEPIYVVLETLFEEVDDYHPDERVRQEVGGIDQIELKNRARSALDQLQKLGMCD
jgi:hypothetical protein